LRKKGGVKVMECNPLCQLSWLSALLMMEPWQTPLNKAPNKGEKKEQKKGPKSEPKEQNPKGVALLHFVNTISLWSSGQVQRR
jgi:hypothetical protein